MYLVIEIIDGEIGAIKSRETWDEAVKIAVKIVVGQGYQDLDEAEIYKIIDENGGFDLPNWYVEICTKDEN
jgi:hypothetical protein